MMGVGRLLSKTLPGRVSFFGADPTRLFSTGPSIIADSPMARLAQNVSPTPPIAGLARSLLALGLLLTMIFTPVEQLFFRSQNFPSGTLCGGIAGDLSLFCLAPPHDSMLSIAIAYAVLTSVVLGILPGVTTWLHAWVAWSFQISSPIPDGGDQVGAMVATWFCLLYFADTRLTHWTPQTMKAKLRWTAFVRYSGSTLLVLQTTVIYGHAFIAKLSVDEWLNGTSLWYWLQHPAFRPPEFIADLLTLASNSWVGTVALNYGTMALEASLMLIAFLPRRAASLIAAIAIVFHCAIGVTFGLWSFFCSMLCVILIGMVVPHLNRISLAACDTNMPDAPDQTGAGLGTVASGREYGG